MTLGSSNLVSYTIIIINHNGLVIYVACTNSFSLSLFLSHTHTLASWLEPSKKKVYFHINGRVFPFIYKWKLLDNQLRCDYNAFILILIWPFSWTDFSFLANFIDDSDCGVCINSILIFSAAFFLLWTVPDRFSIIEWKMIESERTMNYEPEHRVLVFRKYSFEQCSTYSN